MKNRERKLHFIRSTHFRVTLWYTILLGIVSVAFGLFIYIIQTKDIYGESRFRITNKIEDAWRSYERGTPIALQSGDSYAIFDDQGRVIKSEGLSGEEALSLAQAALAGKAQSFRENDGHRGRTISWTEENDGGEVLYGYMMSDERTHGAAGIIRGAILFGSPIDPYGLRGRLLLTILVGVAFMITAAILSGAWLANRALRPVARIARTARSIGEGDLSQRINITTRDELGELSEVFDSMFDRLEAAFDRQKRFVADAGHELRTPLSIISVESERALASKRSTEEYRQSLSTVRTECGYMKKLVEDLLILAKADSGSEGVERTRELIDLGDVVLEALERLAPLAAHRGIALSAGDLPEARLRGDRTALATAITNLVDNAIKYGRNGGRVEVFLEAGTRKAVVRVVDDGPGIPAEKLGKVFDRFYRGDESRAHNGDQPACSGLGLAIVKAIVESHGGSVAACSEPGRGSEFSVILPLAH